MDMEHRVATQILHPRDRGGRDRTGWSGAGSAGGGYPRYPPEPLFRSGKTRTYKISQRYNPSRVIVTAGLRDAQEGTFTQHVPPLMRKKVSEIQTLVIMDGTGKI